MLQFQNLHNDEKKKKSFAIKRKGNALVSLVVIFSFLPVFQHGLPLD